jgi:hypothetical protein
MEETKSLLKSKTFWAAFITVLAGAASMIGYEISPDLQEGILNTAEGIVVCVGGALAIMGRIKASKRIK